MALSQTALEAELRRRLGDPSLTQLPALTLTDALNGALTQYARYRPQYAAHALTTVSGQADYDLPVDVLGISELWAMVPDGMAFSPPWALVQRPPALGADWDPVILGPPDAAFALLESRGFRAVDTAFYGAEVTPGVPAVTGDTPVAEVPAKLTLWPVPQFVVDVVFRVERAPTLAQVPAQMKDVLLLYAEGDALESMGRKRSKSVTQIPTAAGNLKLDTGEAFRSDGAKLKKQFHEEMGLCATVLARG